ncbi:MAG: EAL domain-containing protein [Burkholderiales bacterium]|nr:EAL domain-containing protein [Burkholderiales bacterium]
MTPVHDKLTDHIPALGRLGPLAVAVSALAALSMGLLAWSHHGWAALQERAHEADTLLTTTRYESRQGVWLVEQKLQGRKDIGDAAVLAPMQAAVNAERRWAQTAVPELRPALDRLGLTLGHLAYLQDQRLHHPRQVEGARLQAAQDQVEQSVQAAATQWAQHLEQATEDQHQLVLVNVGLIGGLSLILLVLMARAYRQREQSAKELVAREAQLEAFAQALPDLAFMLDRDGRYVDIFGSNLALLGRNREDLIGRPLTDFFSKEKSALFMRVLRQTLDTRETQQLAYPVRIMGGVRHFDSRCAPVGDTDRVVWMIWDVTQRRRAEQRLMHMTRLYDFLSQVNHAIVRSDSEQSLMDHICSAALAHGRFKKAAVVTFEENGEDGTLRLVCRSEASVPGLPSLSSSFDLLAQRDANAPIDIALRDGRIFHSGDIRLIDQRPAWASTALSCGLAGCATIPLKRDGVLMGHLILLDTSLNAQDADERALMEDLASDLSFALTNLHRETVHKQTEERIRLHAAALESTQDGMVVFNRDQLIVSVNPAFTSITGYHDHEILGYSADILLPDGAQDILGEIANQLVDGQSWQGEVWCQRKSGELFMTKLSVSAVRNRRGRPSHFVGVFTDITQLKQTEERLARMAHFDALTELPNRALIMERLAHAINLAARHETLVGVIFIDLDNFKTVNDGLGHVVGDQLLQQVAQRLQQRVRQEDTLGRLGGDEFVLVLEHLRHPQQAAHVAQSILDTLEEPFVLEGGQQVYVRASIGISLYPADGVSAMELIRDADAAMYESKRRGRNSFSFYTASFTTDANTRLQLETRLRRAVEHEEFVLHYQPMVQVSDRRIVAVEALVRLRHENESESSDPLLGPNQFIPVMEETGMIVPLSDWVMHEACRQAKSWLDAGLDFGRLSINVSPSEIRRGGVVERVSRILNRTGLPAQRLELEITESGLMESDVGAEQFLHMLHELGVSLSIDDFGTGYSSLAYLKRFPVHQLKIDRSFVQDLPSNDSDAQLVSTMITMAQGLKLNVVAEGVEMPDQEAFLASRGCNVIQGYLVSKPVPALQLEALLAAA